MNICIMHFASSSLRIFLAKLFFQHFCMEYYLCYLDAVCTILQRIEFSTKKDIQPFYIGPILFQKINSYGQWSAEKQTIKFYLVPVRNGKMYLVPNDSHAKFYLAVKGLTLVSTSATKCLNKFFSFFCKKNVNTVCIIQYSNTICKFEFQLTSPSYHQQMAVDSRCWCHRYRQTACFYQQLFICI